ncbi:MAG TPA: tail fiber domain-containing protein [Candidatus Eisenbacteria bacterium]|nr:tail fiber domain-containing protein [Candidatus Eisenbacteria bacterium]
MVEIPRRRLAVPRAGALAVLTALLLIPAAAFAATTEQVTRSTEYPSPFGKYNLLGAAKTLTVGVVATGAGAPANAAQGVLTVSGALSVNTGNVEIDEVLRVDGDTFRVYPHSAWGGTHWLGIGVDSATLIGAPGDLHPRVEMEVNGNVYCKRFRAAPGNNYSDDLLYFGVTADGLWVELGSKAGFREIWGIAGGYSDAESAARFNGSPKIVLNYYSTDPANVTTTGNVGIGTVNPTYKLQIGDLGSNLKAIGHSWQVFSSREFKTDIHPLSAPEKRDLYRKLGEMDVVRFRYRDDRPSDRQRLGVIAEVAPREVLSHDDTTLSLSDSIGFVVASIQSLRSEQKDLEAEVARLEAEVARMEKRGAR